MASRKRDIKNARIRQVREYLLWVKASSGCSRCSESRSVCLDFHHRIEADKLFELSRAKDSGMSRLKAEIAKCDILCANCHRILHAETNAEKVACAKEEEDYPLFDLL